MSESKWQEGSDDEEFLFVNEPNDESGSENSSSNEDCSGSEVLQGDLEDAIKLENIDSEEIEQSDGDDDTRHLSVDAKVKHLQESFKSIPPLMIRKVLQRDDIMGDLRAASSCLKAMSSTGGASNIGLQGKASTTNKAKKQKPPVLPKNKKKDSAGKYVNINESTGKEDAAVHVNRSQLEGHEDEDEFGEDHHSVEDLEIDDQEYLSLNEKVKILQEKFKGFPPFVIRKVLGRQDVKEDLQMASECLEKMSPLKGTFKDRDGEDACKESKNQGGRKAWEGKQNGNQGYGSPPPNPDEEPSQDKERGAEVNAGNNTPRNKRNNKRRNRKKNLQSQQQQGNERILENEERTEPGDNFHPGGRLGGYHDRHQWENWEYPQQPQWVHGEYPQQPWGRGGWNSGGPPQGWGRYNNRGGNQRGFPRGGGRNPYADNYYNDANFGPHPHWIGHPYNEKAYPPPSHVFPRSYSEADVRTDGPQQRVNRGQPRPRNNQRRNVNQNAQNRRDGGGHNWVGRGAGRGVGKRRAAQPQNVPCHDDVNNESENLEPNLILIQGLKSSTTFDTIRNFVEARSGDVVHDIAKTNEGLNALVTLEKISNFQNAKREMESRNLEGARVTVHRVPVSSSILVRNLASNTTRDALEYYFSNPRIGGEVTSIQYEEGNEEAVVTFKDPDVMKKVLSLTSLKLNDSELTAERFNPSIQDTTQGQPTQHDIAVAVDKDVMEFISSRDSLRELKESLKVHGFTMKYTSGDTIVYVTPKRAKEGSVNKERGIKTVTDFTKQFNTIELDVDKNHWEAVISGISNLHNEIGKEKLLVKECASSKDKATIICREDDSKDLKRMFLEKIAETLSLEARKGYEKQTIDVEEEKLALLNKTGFKDNHLCEYDELEVDIDQDNGTITITGPKKQVNEAKIKIYQYLSKMSERKISLSQTVFEMLNTEEGLERIGVELRSKQLEAVFCIDEDMETTTASVVGINKKDADEAADLIKSITTEIKIKVDKDIMEVLRTQKWRDLCDEVKQQFKVYVRRNEYFDTWIAGFKGDVSSANDRIQKFLDDNSIGTGTFCCLDKGVRRYIMEHRKDELTNMESSLKQYTVKIKADETADAFLISGTKIGIARVQAAMHVLTSSVAVTELKVQQSGLSKFFTTEKGNRLIKSVEHEHKCAIEKMGDVSQRAKKDVPGQGSEESTDTSSSNESDEGDDVSGQAYSSPSVLSGPMTMTCGNVRISWKQGNIDADDADVLVGSTIGQLSKVFQRAGVAMIQQHAGGVSVVSQCGSLSCNHVILTKCCNWDGGNGGAETQLRSIVQQCLQQALQLNATSIAFPIIGTGGLGFPNNTACQIMISEVINVTSRMGRSSLNDVRFVVFAQDTQLVNAFQQEFTLASGQISGPVQRGGGFYSLMRHLFQGVASGSRTNHFGNVSVQVLQGDLLQQQTDAIVNIIGTDMIMANAGVLSTVIEQAAGPAVQLECSNQGQQPAGSAVVTGPGNLTQFQNIIHVIPGKPLQTCIENCLRTADNHGFGSVSLPAIGTGKSGMSSADSAQATFQALANVCPNLHSLGEVRIVIFQAPMVATFQQTLQQYLTGSFKQSKPHKIPPAKKREKSHAPSKTPDHLDDAVMAIQFHVFGKSKDCVDRAQKDLTKRFTEACKTQAVENDVVSKLSERQRNKLRTKARKLDVSIKFEDRIGRIVVRGDPEDVSTIVNDIWEEIQERGKKEKESEQAEVIYKTVKWQYELHGTRKYFNKSANATIEKAHANDDNRVTVDVQGEKYVIVLATSTGTGLSTGQTMSVTRTTVESNGSHGKGVTLPKDWCPMPRDSSGKEVTVHRFNLANGSAEYQKVHNLFQSTGGRGNILKIERIQNPHLYLQYMVHKQKMDKDNTGMNNEQQLFHGTAEKNVNDINTTGFNRSFGGTAHGTAYGNGVYFARDASYSMGYAKGGGYNNNRHMYLARVLTGRHAPGQSGMIVPPRGFESVANSTGHNASIFVVFYDAQCYPEYLITFQ
ncbi:uncharacterized protein LOC116308576 [Actinia tenebrosa]|uniref:Poly [ADP-ribose] polymerase n=1 Tax=Actinia tenebrosa TaxID=6105 RepID=A0A6P8J5E2_ACTTE|nr:uncharacterized protein LOC116308576 [Actinia tenebrosa]